MDVQAASPARRILARLVEGLLVSTASTALLVVFGYEVFDGGEPTDLFRGVARWSGLLFIAVEITLLRTLGGTLGHLLFGMRAITDDAAFPTWGQAATRTALVLSLPVAVLSAIGVRHGLLSLLELGWQVALLATILAHPLHRGLHDRAGGTTVVRVRR